jgi:choline dehydrogenase-like flavoprotein
MSDSATRGVADRNLKVHGIENLYVCDGSVMPTSGAAHPTLTIVALALRLSDHLEDRIDGLLMERRHGRELAESSHLVAKRAAPAPGSSRQGRTASRRVCSRT